MSKKIVTEIAVSTSFHNEDETQLLQFSKIQKLLDEGYRIKQLSTKEFLKDTTVYSVATAYLQKS